MCCSSYNRYLTVAARAVRRSLKDDKRLAAERRGETELRFAKWKVRLCLRATELGKRDRTWEANGNTACYRTASRASSRTLSRPTTPPWSRLPVLVSPLKILKAGEGVIRAVQVGTFWRVEGDDGGLLKAGVVPYGQSIDL